MSAFEVSDTHIDALVSAALSGGPADTLSWYHGENSAVSDDGTLNGSYEDYHAELTRMRREVTRENAETWGATLLAENRASVNYRYEEDEIEAPYIFTEYTGRINPVAILSALACYEYQACEHPGWAASEAHSFCDALRHHMIRKLDGYSSAPWEIKDPDQAFIGKAQKVWRRGDPMPGAGTVINLTDLI